MVKQILSILVLGSPFYGFAMEISMQAPVFSTYLGEQLTPESIPLLAPLLPSKDLPAIQEWLNNSLHQETIHDLITLRKPLAGPHGNFASRQQQINQILKFQGMPNLSNWNYIFDVPKTNYVIQIAGILNRVKNLLVHNDPNPEDPRLQDTTPDRSWDTVIVKQPATYQTISRIAHYLRAIEAIEKFKLTAFSLPKTYLVGIDGTIPDEANDENSVIVQEKHANAIPVRNIPVQQRNIIHPDALRQLFILTIYAGLWDLNANLLYDATSGKLVISDWEQPNNSNPSDFFHTRLKKVLRNIGSGIGQICGLFAAVPDNEATRKQKEKTGEKDSEYKKICDEFAKLKDEDLIAIGAFSEQ